MSLFDLFLLSPRVLAQVTASAGGSNWSAIAFPHGEIEGAMFDESFIAANQLLLAAAPPPGFTGSDDVVLYAPGNALALTVPQPPALNNFPNPPVTAYTSAFFDLPGSGTSVWLLSLADDTSALVLAAPSEVTLVHPG